MIFLELDGVRFYDVFFEFHKFGVLLVTLWTSGGRPGGSSTFFDDFGPLWGGLLEAMGCPWDPR